jgi:AcrR family transcriptional regulator
MTETARLPLRERQRRETHELIRRAAYELAVERGVAAVSVQDVCAVAGVSSRTFFNHFRSKDEALVPDLPDFPEPARRAFTDAVEPDLVRALESLVAEHLAWMQEHAGGDAGPRAMKRLLTANPELLPRAMAVFEALEQRVAALVAERTGRPAVDLYCTVAALTATSAMRAAFGTWEDGEARDGELLPAVSAAFAVLRDLLARP